MYAYSHVTFSNVTNPTRYSSVLVVSATRAEAAHLRNGTRLVITGLGKATAAMALTAALTRSRHGIDPPVSTVVNIGTAGALHDHHSGLFLPSRVTEHDLDAQTLAGLGYPTASSWDIADGDGTVLATGDSFINDSARRAELAAIADLLDMEGAAFARVAAEFDVPLRLVKVVSDSADESAVDWPARIDAAAQLLADWFDDSGLG
ncbi:nucleosidase [Gordonia crocea]|uniref:Nucleosidase n=1 Tax=Gordonia crocea TaxID=589162 RepID=A0A7I9V086_9ACTN|nr:nucleosidase [Gordonia crocea]